MYLSSSVQQEEGDHKQFLILEAPFPNLENMLFRGCLGGLVG